jgi:hypothetical protein
MSLEVKNGNGLIRLLLRAIVVIKAVCDLEGAYYRTITKDVSINIMLKFVAASMTGLVVGFCEPVFAQITPDATSGAESSRVTPRM